MNKTVKIILGVVIVLAVAGGSFFGGTVYGKSQAQTALQAQFAGGRAGAFPGGQIQGQTNVTRASQGSMLIGEIKTVNADSLIVTDSSNNEITVKVAGTTLIEKNMSVDVTDLAEGETVVISGNKAEDGTITARSLQVAPAGRFNAIGGAAQGGPQGDFQPGGAPPPEQ
jgi:hypothetical protein